MLQLTKLQILQNIKYGDTTEDVRLRSGPVRRETNLSSDDDMLDVNHHTSHYSDNNVMSDCVRIDDASSYSKFHVCRNNVILYSHCSNGATTYIFHLFLAKT